MNWNPVIIKRLQYYLEDKVRYRVYCKNQRVYELVDNTQPEDYKIELVGCYLEGKIYSFKVTD